MTSFPFPATTATSHARSSPPPFDVTERPFVSPISSCSSFLPTRYFGTPRYFGTFLRHDLDRLLSLPLRVATTWRATLRQMLAISRSSERTPASRV